MAVKERPAYREIFPGLYESTDDTRDARLTREFAAAVEQHSGSKVLGQLLQAMLRAQEADSTAHREPR
jgi:hypothetical protein